MNSDNDDTRAGGQRNEQTAGLARALEQARRSPGWNFRPPEVSCFELPGCDCKVYVVPASRWAYRPSAREHRAHRP